MAQTFSYRVHSPEFEGLDPSPTGVFVLKAAKAVKIAPGAVVDVESGITLYLEPGVQIHLSDLFTNRPPTPNLRLSGKTIIVPDRQFVTPIVSLYNAANSEHLLHAGDPIAQFTLIQALVKQPLKMIYDEHDL